MNNSNLTKKIEYWDISLYFEKCRKTFAKFWKKNCEISCDKPDLMYVVNVVNVVAPMLRVGPIDLLNTRPIISFEIGGFSWYGQHMN